MISILFHIFAPKFNAWLMNKNGNKLIIMACEYLNNVLGLVLKIANDSVQVPKLPYYLKAGNQFAIGMIDGRECLLVIPDVLADGSTIARRVKEITEKTGKMTVLIFNNIDTVRRRIMVTNRTNFVVPGRQAYLPSMGAVFKERGLALAVAPERQMLSPAAQVLLLWHLQRETLDGKNISEMAKNFPYSIKTVSAVVKELEQVGICTIEGDNSGKRLHFLPKDEIWDVVYPMLTSPIQEVMYCDDIHVIPAEMRFITYDRALAAYTFMADFDKKAFAVNKKSETIKKLKASGALNAVEGIYRIEFWKYDPALLAENGMVDALSLALCYKDSGDERVADELKNMVNRICKD